MVADRHIDKNLVEMALEKQELFEKSLLELRDINYSLKLSVRTLELENSYLKQSIEEIKKILEKEADKREKEQQANKSAAASVKTAFITGILGFVTAIVVAVISIFKH
jgi:hypothetical protein